MIWVLRTDFTPPSYIHFRNEQKNVQEIPEHFVFVLPARTRQARVERIAQPITQKVEP